jgi:rhombotail lipoprotein
MSRNLAWTRLACLAVLALALWGCAEPRTLHRQSNLMDYLYPPERGKAQPQALPPNVNLVIPMKIGVAFVPSQGGSWRGQDVIPPAQEGALVQIVTKAFQGRPWIAEVKMIPSSYLVPKGGFDNLDAVGRMYGVDVVALVSVDQVQYTDPKWYSFAYYTIVGAFVLPGDQNDTRTLIDAAVFHPGSRSFLLRAPGTSHVKGSSTYANREVMLREHSQQGLELAMAELAKNLDKSVDDFKTEVQTGQRANLDLIDAQGQSLKQTQGKNWGGSFAWWEAVVALGLLAGSAWRRRS